LTTSPKAIAEELNKGALAEQSRAAKDLGKVAAQIRETLGNDALVLEVPGLLCAVEHDVRGFAIPVVAKDVRDIGERKVTSRSARTGKRDFSA